MSQMISNEVVNLAKAEWDVLKVQVSMILDLVDKGHYDAARDSVGTVKSAIGVFDEGYSERLDGLNVQTEAKAPTKKTPTKKKLGKGGLL